MDNFSSQDDNKIAGIVSYFTIIGWLIAYFALYQNKKTSLASYQLRQTLLFHLVSMVVSYAAGLILFSVGFSFGSTILWVVRLALFIIWVIGFIGALQAEKKPMPLIGDQAQSIFSGI
jgi:uncharacterized membrane protein